MKRLWLILALALAVLTYGGTPAQADHGIGYSHWSNFEWPGYARDSVAARGFYVLDRTGDPTYRAAMQQAINDYTYDQNARGWGGIIPIIVYIDNSQYVGQCDWFPQLSEWHFITVCTNGSSGGVTYTAGLHNAEPYHPIMYVGTARTDYNTRYNIFYHELFHAAGIGFGPCDYVNGSVQRVANGSHSCDSRNLMYPVVPVGTMKRPTGHDYDALYAGLAPHYIFS